MFTISQLINQPNMEFVGSSSSSPDQSSPHSVNPTQPLADRVLRVLHHRLRLLHRSDSRFFILGATGNVYTVTLSATPSCTCPDRTTPCKHILFVLIRVLGIPLDDSCLWRRSLRPCQVNRLLSLPTSADSVAKANARQWFHLLFFQSKQHGSWPPRVEIENGATCPVCLDEMRSEGGQKIVACATCRNPIHQECLLMWKRSSRRRSASCVICRARWRDRADQEKYLNLSAYVSDDDDMGEGETPCGDN